jgi:beta-barrel assembly-enhancing protease
MKRSFASQWMASLLAAALIIVPATVTAQSQTPTPQQAPPSNQQSPAPAGQPTPPTTQAPSAPQTQSTADASGQSSSADQTVPQPSSPNVKSGSEADVDAIGNRKVGHGPELYSLEHDIAIGKQLSQEVEKSAKFIDDPVVIEYVNRVGQNLVRNSDAKVPFTIKVIDSDVVNAFALPGGFFYVNSGLILHADEESELAGVMAHEIAHVCARHGTRQESKSTLVQLASIPAMIFIPYSWAGYAIYQGMNFAIPLTFLKFSRADEAEADYLGLQYMYKAGYDPNSFVSFFEKVQADEKKQPGTIPKVFSTHPPTPDRIEAIQKEIATILPARDQYIVTTSEFDTVKARLQMIEQNIKVKDNNPNKPTLRKKTAQNKGGSTDPNSTSTSGGNTGGNNGGASGGNNGPNGGDTSDDSDRPTLKHRTDDPNN